MFCGECGTENPDTNSFCKNCGKALKKIQPVVRPAPAPAPAPAMPPQPADAQGFYIPQSGASAPAVPAAPSIPATGTGTPVPAAKSPKNWLGTGSIILGILAWLIIPYILGIIAMILGAVSVYKLKKTQGKIAIMGVFGIVIALAAMLINYLYIFIS